MLKAHKGTTDTTVLRLDARHTKNQNAQRRMSSLMSLLRCKAQQTKCTKPRGADSSGLDTNQPPHQPLGGGGGGGGRRGDEGGLGVSVGGGAPFGAIGGGGTCPQGQALVKQAPVTSPCPSSNHTITLNLTLTFAVSWFDHASHVD